MKLLVHKITLSCLDSDNMNVALNFILRSKLNENQLSTTSEKVRSATYIIFDSIEGLGPSIKRPVVHTCKVAVCPS